MFQRIICTLRGHTMGFLRDQCPCGAKVETSLQKLQATQKFLKSYNQLLKSYNQILKEYTETLHALNREELVD